jgi:protein-serine/threonine kinase
MSIHPNMNLAYLSLNVRNLMSKLLQKNPNQRPQSITEIKSHPWFSGVNWNDIIAKKIKPPLIPDLFKSNFEQDCLNLPLDFDESTQSKVRSTSFYHDTDHIGDGSTGAGPIERQ